MRKLFALTALASALGGAGGTSTAEASNQYAQVQQAVCHYFRGSLCSTAMQIVNCETGGTYDPRSSNGQYLGIFQMGSNERATFGHGNDVWTQARAAYRYYLKAGFGPWLNYEPTGCGR